MLTFAEQVNITSFGHCLIWLFLGYRWWKVNRSVLVGSKALKANFGRWLLTYSQPKKMTLKLLLPTLKAWIFLYLLSCFYATFWMLGATLDKFELPNLILQLYIGKCGEYKWYSKISVILSTVIHNYLCKDP